MRLSPVVAFAIASVLPSMASADIQVRNETEMSVRAAFFNQTDLLMAIACTKRDLAANESTSVERPNFVVCDGVMKVKFTAERPASGSNMPRELTCLVETVAWTGANVTARSSGEALTCTKD